MVTLGQSSDEHVPVACDAVSRTLRELDREGIQGRLVSWYLLRSLVQKPDIAIDSFFLSVGVSLRQLGYRHGAIESSIAVPWAQLPRPDTQIAGISIDGCIWLVTQGWQACEEGSPSTSPVGFLGPVKVDMKLTRSPNPLRRRG